MGEQKYVTYFRVSTDRQGRSGLGLEAQRKAVSQFLSSHSGIAICEFVEIESGSRDDRPKLIEALSICQKSKATLLIAKLDRLARSVSFVAGLMDGNVDFVAVDMPHASRFVLHIMAAVAEHERQLISERTKAALAAAKARGVQLGTHGAALAEMHLRNATDYAQKLSDDFAAAISSGATSTRQIANFLNAASIRSREGRKWHPASVARIKRRLDLPSEGGLA